MHLDMDAFFASVEQAHDPRLRGKPVIVGGTPEGRGVVSTCSYEAREYGVHSAMPAAQAVKLCPNGVFIHTSADKYSHISLSILRILNEYSPNVEPFSIDEAFLDITETAERYGGPKQLALRIKDRIREKHNLTASIGIASVRFIAKIASSICKPDGLTIIETGREKEYLWPQPIGNLWGVGPKSEEAFRKIGIKTIGDLARFPKYRLKKYFGIVGESLRDMANGIGEDEIRSFYDEPKVKSMGHEHTFERDVIDPDRVSGMLLYLSDKVSRRLRQSNFRGKTITLKVRHSDFKLKTRAKTLYMPTDCAVTIFQGARYLLEKNRLIEKPIRLIGVSVSKLEKKAEERQQELTANPDGRRIVVDKVIDSLKDKYGEHMICRAGANLIFH
jgi:DNA polymerase-4